MKKLIILIGAIIIALSWDRKCEHVFVAVEPLEITVNACTLTNSIYSPIFGKHQGRELICLKCQSRANQVVDYGSDYVNGFGSILPPLDADSIVIKK